MTKFKDKRVYQQRIYSTGQENRYSLLYFSILIVSLSTFVIGYDTVLVSSALVFVKDYFRLSFSEVEVLVSSILLSAVLGSLLGWPSCLLLGRKKTMVISSLLFIIGSIFVFFAPLFPVILVGRCVIGLGLGLVSMAALIYISEIVPTKIRGSSVCFLNFIYNFGIFAAFLVGFLFTHTNSWRWILASSIVPALLFLFLLPKVFETPQWFIAKKKHDEAEEVLSQLRRNIDVQSELESIEENLENENTKWKNLWSPGVFKALLIGTCLALFMEITGMDAVFYYAPFLLKTLGFESTKASIASGLAIASSSLFFSLLAVLLIDKWGRRKLLLSGLIIMIIGLLMVALISKYYQLWPARNALMLFALIIFSAGFSLGIGTVGWLLISEIYPMKIRDFAVASAITIKWLANFFVARTFLSTITKIGLHKTFWVYTLISIAAWVFVYFFVPETSGKSLETIEAFWLESKKHGTKIES